MGAVEGAYFQFVDAMQGTVPAIIAPYLVAKVKVGNAKRMISSAENVSAEKAKVMGLVSELAKDVDDAHKKVAEVAEVLTACGPRSVEAAKALVIGVGGQPIGEPVVFFTGRMLASATSSSEAEDGMKCVQSRRPKPWEEKPIKPLYGVVKGN